MSNIVIHPDLDNNAVIWHYLSFPAFLSLLKNEELLFRRVDDFKDQLEGTMPPSVQQKLADHLKQNLKLSDSEVTSKIDREKEIIENYKKSAYVNCWTINEDEDYAFWKIYSDNQGIAIKSTVGKLHSSLIYDKIIIKNNANLTIRKVNYDFPNSDQDSVICYKYKYYDYESELRVFFRNQRDLQSEAGSIIKGYNDDVIKFIKVNVEKLIGEIWISPFAKKWFDELLTWLLKEKFGHLNIQLKKSDIKLNS